jgi:HEAT repeat protein
MDRFAATAMTGVFGLVLIVTGAAAPVLPQTERAQEVPPAVTQEIESLVAQLASRDTSRARAWRATARLQTLGPPAVTALVAGLRQDTFRNVDHGTHSAIQEALEKFGPPAIAELDRVLTLSVLSSTDAADVDYVRRAMAIVGRVVDADGAAALLVRVAGEASNPRVRSLAFQLLNGGGLGSFEYIPGAIDESWREWREICAGRHWSGCPFDVLSPRLAAALRPVLADVEDLVRREPDSRVRFAGAQVLATWGEGAIQRAGEQHLIALVVKPGPSFYTERDDDYVRGQSIEALGLLGVAAGRDAIAVHAGASSDELRLTVARALARLRDPAYIPIVIDLMTSQTPRVPYWSMEIARRSRDTAFVPALIDRVDDQSWNGIVTTSTVVDGKLVETRVPIGADALEALRALTFQDFGADAGAWRAWWASNRSDPWRSHLIQFVEQVVPQMETAAPWVMNRWTERLRNAADPAALPFVTAYLRHPRVSPGAITASSGGTWTAPHPSVALLMGLVGQGSVEARQLLYECADATAPRLAVLSLECTRSVASFDRRRAADRLAMLLSDRWNRMRAAELLLQLGDARGIPALIDELESSDDASRWLAPRAISVLRFYTQQDIAYDPDATSEERRAAAIAWRQWWQGVQGTFVLRMLEARIDMQCSGLLVSSDGCR